MEIDEFDVPERRRKRVSTGIESLDFALRGGIPETSMVSVVSDPRFSIDSLLFRFASVRRTYYVSVTRDPKYISLEMDEELRRNVKFIDLYSHYYSDEFFEDDERVLLTMENEIKRLRSAEREANIIFENFSFFLNFNLPEKYIWRLLRKIYEICKERCMIAYLHLVKNDESGQKIAHIAELSDVVIEIELETTATGYIYRLSIPKMRGGALIGDFMKLYVTESGKLEVDTTRDIV
jgi:KaiC/GvpD/RAD55 family RecA-like ATPase